MSLNSSLWIILPVCNSTVIIKKRTWKRRSFVNYKNYKNCCPAFATILYSNVAQTILKLADPRYISITGWDKLYFEDNSFYFPFTCSSWRDLELDPRSLSPWKAWWQANDNVLEEILVLVDSLPYAPLRLTIGGRLAKVESIREPTNHLYVHNASRPSPTRAMCMYHLIPLSFSPSTVAQWLCSSLSVCSSLNPSFFPLAFQLLRMCPHFYLRRFSSPGIFPPFFLSYSRDNAKSCRVNTSSPFDGAPSFCSRKFSAVTPFSSPVSARWPTQFGKQMLSM